MNSIELLEELLFTARVVTERYLEDLTFEDICLTPGAGTNPIVWQLGHLIVSEVEMVQRLSKEEPISFPPSFVELHQKQAHLDLNKPGCVSSSSENDSWQRWLGTIRSLYVRETYVDLLRMSRSRSIQVLHALTSEDLVRPAPEEMARYAKTWASVFVMIGLHEIQHAGQIAVLRRNLGKRIVI